MTKKNNTRKQIFFTSDLHIGHENSIKFDNRPFKDLDDMHRTLIKNFNKQVPEDGLTYFLGDIVVGSFDSGKEFISKLNGTKILIVGNHDRAFQSCYDMGFDAVMYNSTIIIHKQIVTMSHCPLMGVPREDTSQYPQMGLNWHGEYKKQNFSVENKGQFHLHGHIHSRPNNGKSQKILGRQFDVGVPANNYRPVHISEIESWIYKELNDESNS